MTTTASGPNRGRFPIGRLASPSAALALGAVSLLSVPATFVLTALIHQLPNSYGGGVSAAGGVAFVLAFTAVGVVVARRQPGNPMGWLLLAVALAVQIGNCASAYAYLDYTLHRGTLVLGPLAVLLSPSWEYAFILLPFLILLFPGGRVPPGWRWPTRAFLALACVVVVATLELAVSDLGLRQPVDDSGNLAGINHPIGAHAWFGVVQPVALVACVLFVLAAAVYQIWSFHRARGERRQQLKWLGYGAAVLVMCLVINAAAGGGSGVVGDVTFSIGLAALPLGMGVAIMRYHLYDIDRLISRTLSYAILTALLGGTFVGLVVLTTDALPFSSAVGVAASTLAAAALFNPLRRRVQRVVDRRFNRARYDAQRTVEAFAARLRDAVDLDTVQAELLEVVGHAVEPSHASVWLRPAHHSTRLQTPG